MKNPILAAVLRLCPVKNQLPCLKITHIPLVLYIQFLNKKMPYDYIPFFPVWTHLMGKGQSCHGDPQGVRHHRSRGLKMCLCDSKYTLCTDTETKETREEKSKGT